MSKDLMQEMAKLQVSLYAIITCTREDVENFDVYGALLSFKDQLDRFDNIIDSME